MDRFMRFRFGGALGNLDDVSLDDIVAFLGRIGAAAIRIGARRRHRICAPYFGFCSGVAKRTAIW
jgi:hypothetical protein